MKPQYEVREALPEHAEAVRRVQAAAWLATYPNRENGVSYEWVKERTDNWLTPDRLEESKAIFGRVASDPLQFLYVAKSKNELVGFIHFATKAKEDVKELEAIYTLPETFGSGVGQRLMDAAVEWIGDFAVELSVASYNTRAIRFYEKNGFTIVSGSDSLYKDTIPVIRMSRKGERHD